MRKVSRLHLLALAVSALAFPSLGQADSGSGSYSTYGGKVDELVAIAAAKDPGTPLQAVLIPTTGISLTSVVSLVEKIGGDAVASLGAGAVVAEIEPALLGAVASSPLVGYILPDLPMRPDSGLVTAGTSGVDYASMVNAPSAWAQGLDGRGVGIAIIDSGVAPVADFGSRLVQVRFDGRGDSSADVFGHGSFVAGVAAGKNAQGLYRGIAPGATVYALKVSRDNEGAPRTSDVIAALDWVTLNRSRLNIRVAVLSLSEGVPSSYHGSLLDASVEHAWRSGVVVVTSAGNRGKDSQHFAPANDPFAIAVGALDVDGQTPVGFSSTGKTVDGYERPDIYAPGRHIVSVLPTGSTMASLAPLANLISPGYGRGNGTSFAAPQVAGAVAILLQKRPTLTPDQVKWLLVESGRSISGSDVALDIRALLGLGRARDANGGIAIGNCTGGSIFSLLGQLSPCALPGSAYLALFDCRAAAKANQEAYTAASWNAASWNGATWNGASWNAASWNAASWNAASWNAASWNAASWNAASWNGATWN